MHMVTSAMANYHLLQRPLQVRIAMTLGRLQSQEAQSSRNQRFLGVTSFGTGQGSGHVRALPKRYTRNLQTCETYITPGLQRKQDKYPEHINTKIKKPWCMQAQYIHTHTRYTCVNRCHISVCVFMWVHVYIGIRTHTSQPLRLLQLRTPPVTAWARAKLTARRAVLACRGRPAKPTKPGEALRPGPNS